MQILFDAIPLTDARKTGVAYFAEGLISGLAKQPGVHVDLMYFNFLSRKNISLPDYGPGAKSRKLWHFPGKLIRPAARVLGVQTPIEALSHKKYDWLFFPNFISLPSLRKTKNMIVVHDLCFLEFPEYVDSKNVDYLQRIMPSCIARADKIACVSKFTEDRLIELFPGAKGKTFVTHVPPVFDHQATSLTPRLQDLGIKDGGYFLFLGTLEPRKNLVQLVDAYCALPATTKKRFSLVLAGGLGWMMDDQIAYIHAKVAQGEHIILTGYCTGDERQGLYEHACSFVISSHYEGFGMPVLEAMVYGLPTIVSDIPVFHELCGDSVNYFHDTAELTKLMSAHTTASRRLDYSSILKSYSWDNVAQKVLKEMES